MSISRRKDHEAKSAIKPIYRTSFVNRCHRILKMGYDRLDAKVYSNSVEEDITGELTRAMQEALQALDAPKWAKNFWASEEIRVHDDSRRGKDRLRIDIEMMQHQAGSRPRFRFEAKRLRDADSRSEYLGTDGLKCFLDGRYAREDEVAGMLGYVQGDSIETHATKIQKALTKNPKKHSVTDDGQWMEEQIVPGLSTYKSTHKRVQPLPQIVILHSLLLFC